MIKFPDLTEERKKTAILIRECLYGGLIVREALKQWPDCYGDPTLICARHALIHFAADEDINKNDPKYRDAQIEWLENLINILSKGNEIPKNIIESYEEYYVLPVSLKSRIIKFINKIQYTIKGYISFFYQVLSYKN
jgi:hypothetical protein